MRCFKLKQMRKILPRFDIFMQICMQSPKKRNLEILCGLWEHFRNLCRNNLDLISNLIITQESQMEMFIFNLKIDWLICSKIWYASILYEEVRKTLDVRHFFWADIFYFHLYINVKSQVSNRHQAIEWIEWLHNIRLSVCESK